MTTMKRFTHCVAIVSAVGSMTVFEGVLAGMAETQGQETRASRPMRGPAAVQSCGKMGAPEKVACYEKILLPLVSTAGVEIAMETLSIIGALDRDVQRDGHVYAHAIGVTAYQALSHVGRAFSRCSELYQSGCYHGVVQAYLDQALDPHATTDPGRLDAVCETYRNEKRDDWLLFQCVHALGHGLTIFHAHDLPRALQACDLLGDEWDRHSCYGGVFMENIVHVIDPHGHTEHANGRDVHASPADAARTVSLSGPRSSAFKPVDPGDLLHPCSVLDEQYAVDCYLMQTSVMLYHNHGDIQNAAMTCSRAPVGMRPWCYQSLGRDISSYSMQEYDESIRMCGLGEERYQPWCYVGLVKNFIDVTSNVESGLAFCPRVPGRDNKLKCYEAVGEQIAVLEPRRPQRAALCEDAAADDVDACRYGARLTSQPPKGLPSAARESQESTNASRIGTAVH